MSCGKLIIQVVHNRALLCSCGRLCSQLIVRFTNVGKVVLQHFTAKITRGGRDRFHSEYAPRFEERGNFGSSSRMGGQNDSQTSRHLWVGNLSPRVTEAVLAEQFLRFGELESIALYPGRFYAFVNFRKEEDAAIALKGLQGFVVAGMALRIEFAKGAKPSRHLHVTGICPSVSGEALEAEFRRIGVLEGFQFDRDQGVALIDYVEKDDAITALASLNRKRMGRQELRIDYGRPHIWPQSDMQERPLQCFPGEEFLPNRDERHSAELGEPFHRESRTHSDSPDNFHFKSKGAKSAEPSEILWIGFPAHLNVDEMILRKSFSPYGEIVKITTFPGRSYAFVKYKSVVAACKAKDALLGKLFNNPRVNICFSKSEIGPVEHGRSSTNSPFPSHKRIFDDLRNDRNFGSSTGESHMKSPPFVSKFSKMPLDSGASAGFGQNSLRTGPGVISNAGGSYENRRFQRFSSELGPSEDLYESHPNPRSSPGVDGGSLWRGIPPEGHHHRSPPFDDFWDLPDDTWPFREAKKLRTGSELLPDKELPEYPFSDLSQDMQHTSLQKPFHVAAETESYTKSFDSRPFGLEAIPEPSKNLRCQIQEKESFWNAHDRFEAGSGPLSTKPVRRDRFTPDSHQSPLNEEWKWQGTIAKGGTPVCRARCFPVGKALDIMLPEFLDCTARTGLDMLSKHFFQAASARVVFFVPESDSDIILYNEFMSYLREKQRAAVAKLGEKTTLFLVPPSEFSEKVLKVPGKLSISGVILRFQHPNSNFGSLQNPMGAIESKPPPLIHGVSDKLVFPEDKKYMHPSSPDLKPLSWGQSYMSSSSESPNLATSPFPLLHKSVVGNSSYPGNVMGSSSSASFIEPISSRKRISESLNESRFDQLQHQNLPFQSNWPSHQAQDTDSSLRNFPPQASMAASNAFHNDEYLSMKQRPVEGTSSGQYIPASSGISLTGSMFSQQQSKPQVSSSMPIPQLQPEQLAQLASLLAQKQPSGKLPILSPGEDRKQEFPNTQHEQAFKTSHHSNLQKLTSATSESLVSQFAKMPQLQQNTNNGVSHTSRTELQTQSSEVAVGQASGEEDTETDPQKRLQATLQLAAALLQQIQQQATGKVG